RASTAAARSGARAADADDAEVLSVPPSLRCGKRRGVRGLRLPWRMWKFALDTAYESSPETASGMAEQQARRADRPLSPHLQISRWPVRMGTSILHRVTGFGLALGTLLLAWWLVAAALGPGPYDTFQHLAFHWFGRFILFCFTLTLVFHAVNGLRHLAWDLG